jgi:hypothetical protein
MKMELKEINFVTIELIAVIAAVVFGAVQLYRHFSLRNQ